MKSIQKRKVAMLNRVVDFGTEYEHLFPKASEAEEAFAAVAAAVKQVQDQSAARISSEDKGKGIREAARTALHDRLTAMVQTARAIGETAPRFEGEFLLPEKPDDHELIGAGRTFMANAEAVKKEFIAHAFPSTFIADLKTLVDTFEEAVHERDANARLNATAQTAIDLAIEEGLRQVRRLDAMVRVTLGGDELATTVWERLRRVPYRKAKAATPAPEPVAPTPAPVVATPAPTPSPIAIAPAPVAPSAPAPAPVAVTPSPVDAPPVVAPTGLDAGIPSGPASATKAA